MVGVRIMSTRVLVLTAADTPGPRLAPLADVQVVQADQLAEALPGAEVLLVWDFFSRALAQAWSAAGDLRWVHIAAAGVDSLLFDELTASEVVVTNARGVFDRPIAEFVLGAVLAHDKQFQTSQQLQAERRWLHRELTRTEGSTALVVGTGGIGRATARLLTAIGLQVHGVGRRARSDDPDFITVTASDDLVDVVGLADHLVLAAPLTVQTRGLIDRRVLAAMKPSAHLINVGRGALVHQPALVEALHEGRIAAATLDVFDTEPLPPDHPLWTLRNVRISPHLSGDVTGWRDALAAQFEDNLRRYLTGQPLVNVVDLTLGYVPGAP